MVSCRFSQQNQSIEFTTGYNFNFMAQVVQKLIDWGADVNQMRFDTDVGC
jgi:hypothetical protein